MKRAIFIGLCFLLFVSSWASAEAVPEETLHEAIMTMTWADDQGECWVEGHVVLGTEETSGGIAVYALVQCQNDGFMAGLFTDTGGGFVCPVTMTFDKTASGYVLREIQKPEDGARYKPSLEAMMPKACLDLLQERGAENVAEIKRQMRAQARAYVDGIGRTESVGDWRDLNLQLPDMLVVASNQTLGFSPPYPLWVTETERLENGERYVYQRSWTPDEASEDARGYRTSEGDTLVCEGKTGVETLTKTRRADGAVVETVSIRAEPYDLIVTYADAYGTKEYRFAFDGKTYHQPTVTRSGDCRVNHPAFDLQYADLPQ